MFDGFIKVAAASPELKVADVKFNLARIIEMSKSLSLSEEAKIIVFPELALTSYSCQDLFLQTNLIKAAEDALVELIQETSSLDSLILVGLPAALNSKLYNVAALIYKGSLLGLVPKLNIPNYNEFYELRHFSPGQKEVSYVDFAGFVQIPFGAQQLVELSDLPECRVAVEICEDLWVANPPSIAHAEQGATIICNLSASNALVGKADYRRQLIQSQSARLCCAYIYSSSNWQESSQDLVFSAHKLIAENGLLLADDATFDSNVLISEVDVSALSAERRRLSTFSSPAAAEPAYWLHHIDMPLTECKLSRFVDPAPFVPSDATKRRERCEEVFNIQAYGLAKRLQHTHSQTAVIGVSGGLDSTLALLVVARAFDILGLDHKGILCVTMPGFGTTERTHGNAQVLADSLDCTLREVSIVKAVRQHFADIDHREDVHDVTYENAQARERTQILMDIANQELGLVIGTGDLSELALGWATYNADHMSMYGVNASIPKTLVRHLVRYVADTTDDASLTEVLLDVLDTPVSPELLPAAKDGSIAQKTEDLVGPYELHDFFLYQVLRRNFSPAKVYRLALIAHGQNYSAETILKWLKNFYRRFFSQQFKRSCLPDGPKVGTVSVSPRGDLRMPSDAMATLWLSELEQL